MTQSHVTASTDTVTKPLYATVGAGDALYNAVNELFDKARDRAGNPDVGGRVDEARERLSNLPADAQEQFATLRRRLSDLPAELPDDLAELREKLTAEELRRVADRYYRQLRDTYSDLASRGTQTVDRLRAENVTFDEQFGRVEDLYGDVVNRAEDAFDRVSGQARGLFGQDDEASDGWSAAVADVEQTPDVESTVDAGPTLDAEVVHVTTEPEPVSEPDAASRDHAGSEDYAPSEVEAEVAPARKAAPAKKAPAKKATKKTGTAKK